MMAAAQAGHKETVKALIEGGASLDIKNSNNNTALGYASSSGHAETVRVLVEAGADFDIQDIQGFSPLMNAALRGKEDVVATLLDVGANPDLGSTDGPTGVSEGRLSKGGVTVFNTLSSYCP